MIELDPSKLHDRFIRLMPEHRPTHAALTSVHKVLPTGSLRIDPGLNHLRAPKIDVTYEYGRLVDGVFVSDPQEPPIQSGVWMQPYVNPEMHEQTYILQAMAMTNIRNAGVSPHPERPHEPVQNDAARQDDYSDDDLDAYFAFFDARLLGKVVSNTRIPISVTVVTTSSQKSVE